MATGTAINDLWAELCEPLILEQYRESPNLKALIKIFVDAGQSFESAINSLKKFYDLDSAPAAALDLIGELLNIPRKTSESDADYRDRIKAAAKIETAGTPNYFIDRVAELSGDSAPIYHEEDGGSPVVFVMTENGRKLSRQELKPITTAGVLSVPGSRFVFADGKRIISGHGVFYPLTDDSGAEITDENGETINIQLCPERSFIGVARG